MKILYDHQIFANQQFGGISRYFYDLLKSYHEQGVDFDLALQTTPSFYLLSDEALKAKLGYSAPVNDEVLPGINFRGKGRLNRALGRSRHDPYSAGLALTKQKLQAGEFDIFHPTYYDPYFLDEIGDKPYVITVYDMTHELYIENMAKSEWARIPQKYETITRAKRIIAISENTKRDIVNILGVAPEKIDVVYLTNALGTGPVATNVELPDKYLFYVGHRWAYKNFLVFAQVFAQMSREDTDLYLVCAGGGAFSADEQNLFALLGISNRVVYAGGKDEIIRAGYAKASAFVYPSLYEGFGIPLLEAFALDCPVVCSNTGSFAEVGGDAAEYFTPKDWQQMHTALKKVVYDQDYRLELIKRGKDRTQLFSAERLSKETLAVYDKALSS